MAGALRYEVVLFDLGGTLVDEYDFAGWAGVAGGIGLDADPDLVRHAFQEVVAEVDARPIGPMSDASVRAVFWQRVLGRACERPVDAGTARRFLDAQERAPEPTFTVYSDVRRCLDALAEQRRRLGVVSNSVSEASVRRILALTGIAPYFDAVVSSGTEGVAKPDPAIFARAVARFGASADRTFYVGNLEHTDALAARAAGLGSVWLNREGTGFTDGTPELTSLLELPILLEELEGNGRDGAASPSHA